MKILNSVFLILNTVLLATSIAHGNKFYISFFVLSEFAAAYFLMDTLGWFAVKTLEVPQPAEVTMITTPISITPPETAPEQEVFTPPQPEMMELDSTAPAPRSAEYYQRIVQSEVANMKGQEAIFQFIESAPVDPRTSELRYFDRMTENFQDGKPTLVISHFHHSKFTSETLMDHLNHKAELEKIICKEISPGIDLIPYSGKIDFDCAIQAHMFLAHQFKVYQRVVFLLPKEQLTVWQEIIANARLNDLSQLYKDNPLSSPNEFTLN